MQKLLVALEEFTDYVVVYPGAQFKVPNNERQIKTRNGHVGDVNVTKKAVEIKVGQPDDAVHSPEKSKVS